MTYKRGEHPNSRRNLEQGQFKKGQSGNPLGRPQKELSITSILRDQLGEPCPYAPGKTWVEWLARRALELAGENPAYYRELLDRVEGKVSQLGASLIQQDRTVNICVIDEETKYLVEHAGDRTKELTQPTGETERITPD